jgi:hypothetical protein
MIVGFSAEPSRMRSVARQDPNVAPKYPAISLQRPQ